MELKNVISSTIKAIGYNKEKRELYIEFKESNKIYTYHDFPKLAYKHFKESNSLGSFFANNIKNKFSWTKVEAEKQKKINKWTKSLPAIIRVDIESMMKEISYDQQFSEEISQKINNLTVTKSELNTKIISMQTKLYDLCQKYKIPK